MLKHVCLRLAAASLPFMPAAAARAPAVAQPAPTSAERPSAAEAAAFVKAYAPSDLRREAELAMLRKDFIPGLRRQPEMADLLDAFPALGPAMVGAMESQIDIYIEEFEDRFVPRATKLVRQSMTRADTLTLTRFYGSPLGRKMVRLMAMNLDGSEVVDRAFKMEAIDEGVAKRQMLRSAFATVGQLSDEERDQIIALARSPEGTRLRPVLPAFRAIQIELMNNPGPRFAAGSDAAMRAAFKRVTGVELPGQK